MRTTIRFTGLASGMDTESIVKSMIAPQQYKVDNAKQNKLLMELKKESWKEMNNKIYEFYRTTLNDIKFTNNYGKAEAILSDPNIFRIDPNTNMPEGEHELVVKQLAKSASVTTGKITKDREGKPISATKQTKLYDLGFEYGDVITINGRELTVQEEVRRPVRVPKLDDDGNPVLGDDGNPVMEDKEDADGKVVTEVVIRETTIADVEKLLQSKKYEYVNKLDSDGKPIYIKNPDGTDSAEIEQVLVTERDPNMNATFDAKLGAFMISTKNTGEKQKITFDVNGDGDETIEKFGELGITIEEITDEDGTVVGYGAQGKEAIFEYNGIEVRQEGNKVNVNGLQGVLTAESEIIGEKGERKTTTVSVTKDIQASVDFVKNFVEEYNKLIDEMNTLVNAPANNKYKPLTDEQKKDMSESDIKLWDEKVKASVLRNDSTLKDLTAEMRRTIGDSDLFKFGISTGDWKLKDNGKLHIDEDKLKDMLTKDPSGFEAALKKVGTDLYDGINKKLIRSTDAKSANFLFSDKMLDKQIKDTDKTIFTLEDRLLRQEDMYYKRFTAMEKMISQLNNQGSWLSSQLGGM